MGIFIWIGTLFFPFLWSYATLFEVDWMRALSHHKKCRTWCRGRNGSATTIREVSWARYKSYLGVNKQHYTQSHVCTIVLLNMMAYLVFLTSGFLCVQQSFGWGIALLPWYGRPFRSLWGREIPYVHVGDPRSSGVHAVHAAEAHGHRRDLQDKDQQRTRVQKSLLHGGKTWHGRESGSKNRRLTERTGHCDGQDDRRCTICTSHDEQTFWTSIAQSTVIYMVEIVRTV